jgi:hypothetical protein
MINPVLDYMIGFLIILVFALWIWWRLRLQEIIAQGDFSRLPKRISREYEYDDFQIPSDQEHGYPSKHWRLLPLAIIVVPNMFYLFDNTRPLTFAVRLFLVTGMLLVFGLCIYYLDHKLLR